MKMVFSNHNRFIVANAFNILESQGVDVFLKNEHAASAIGEVSAFDAWVEVWVTRDLDYDRACSILENAISDAGDPEWICADCGEANDASFDVCWQCQGNPVSSS